VLSAPRLQVAGGITGPGAVVIENGRIAAVLDHVPAASDGHLALGYGVLGPGLVDLQVNGFAGHDLMQADAAGWDEVRRSLPATGVTSFLPTYITAPLPTLLAAADRAATAGAREVVGGARVLGVHLEGPFLSPLWRGTHSAEGMCDPDPLAVARVIARGSVAMITMAPELTGAGAAIARLREAGVLVSLGHSDADAECVAAAVDTGARMVTHVFNAMRPLHHREPALPGVALTDERLAVGLICDGHHVAEVMCRLVFQATPGRVVLVTDATAAAAMPQGRYQLGGRDVEVEAAGDPPRLADGTIAGSALTLDQAVRNAVSYGLGPGAALQAASGTPARMLGRDDIGHLQVGARADLVWWSDDIRPQRIWLDGQQLPEARVAAGPEAEAGAS
jgi:N-acetylglucosamine-6-phosphate deacetylase